MEGKTGNKGDASNSEFSSTDKMRFCSMTYEIIEELKLRRQLAAENEKKIETLINDRFTLGWKLDQERGKLANLIQKHESELRETRRALEQKMKDCQEEASQQQVYRKMAEKEKDALKDEIRRLQLSNYSLEKRLRESEHQEKIQANEREQHILQVSRFETLHKQLDGMVKQLTSKQELLDRDKFSSTDKMRFCSLTYEITEELKLRRQLAAENEKKIETLINDRFTLGWKLDQERGKLANLIQKHESELRETRRALEQKMKDCQVETSQQQVYKKMVEKEKDALKDEIRRLQLSNYSLEKRLRESEHQEKIQANERAAHPAGVQVRDLAQAAGRYG